MLPLMIVPMNMVGILPLQKILKMETTMSKVKTSDDWLKVGLMSTCH